MLNTFLCAYFTGMGVLLVDLVDHLRANPQMRASLASLPHKAMLPVLLLFWPVTLALGWVHTNQVIEQQKRDEAIERHRVRRQTRKNRILDLELYRRWGFGTVGQKKDRVQKEKGES